MIDQEGTISFAPTIQHTHQEDGDKGTVARGKDVDLDKDFPCSKMDQKDVEDPHGGQKDNNTVYEGGEQEDDTTGKAEGDSKHNMPPSLPPPPPTSDNYITECATTWSVIGFLITSSHAIIYARFALTSLQIYNKFYPWVTKPLCLACMAISMALKPRRTDMTYMAFLYTQYSILTFLVELLFMVGYNWDCHKVLQGKTWRVTK